MSSVVAIVQKVVQPKEKGRRRTSDWCAICMEEYEFLSINETIGEECCVKKTANSGKFFVTCSVQIFGSGLCFIYRPMVHQSG